MAGYSGNKQPLLVIAGPTATGKTEAAVAAARLLDGEIVSADSMQIYRTLDIGTAKPTAQQRAAIPHHLIDIRDPQETYSAADYVRDANAAIDGIAARGRLPILCGGTGLYIDALVSGLEFQDQPENDALRMRIKEEYAAGGAQPLLDELFAADPDYAATLHPNNVKRLLRAVEKLRATGLTQAQLAARSRRAGSRFRCHYAVLNCERAQLYARIEARVDAMLRAGLVQEARYVYDNRARFETAREAIGYKEMFPLFEGSATADECAAQLKQATRRYAKRQLTWFRRAQDAVWYDALLPPGELAQKIRDGFCRSMQIEKEMQEADQ